MEQFRLMQETLAKLLQRLLADYKKDPRARSDVKAILQEIGVPDFQIHQYAHDLKSTKWLRYEQHGGGRYIGTISLKGILDINPDYFDKYLFDVMGDLCDLGGQGNLYEILASDPKKPLHMHREFVSDLADYLYTEKRFIEKPSITLKRCTVRLTPKGIEYCEQNRATFFS